MSKLALLGGPQTRNTVFSSRPHVDENERNYINQCLDGLLFSRFIGSPVKGFRQHLALTSAAAFELKDFWSVLGGPFVRKFEALFAAAHEVKYAVCSNSATSSITSAMIAVGVKPGDEVITTPFSFTATATAIRLAGARVVFADIDPRTFCVTAETIAARVTPRTKAIVPVHILGNAGDIVAIRDLCRSRSIALVEDSAQALHSKKNGQYLGTFGAAGIFSFQETKNIMTGEGGMAITNDEKMAYKMRLVRNHGEAMVTEGEDEADLVEAAQGYNFRLPEPLAALGAAQTEKMKFLNDIRRENMRYLLEGMKKFTFLTPQLTTNDPGEYCPYCLGFTFERKGIHRNTFAEALRAEGIPCSTGFPRLLNENPLTREDAKFTPNAKRLNEERYLGFFQMGNPNKKSDMDDILRAIAKVEENFAELEKVDGEYRLKREYQSGRG